VRTNARFITNAVEQTVVAEARGTTHAQQRFVFSAHVQEPGANDNASGVGAQLEMARVMARLLADGMPRPARTRHSLGYVIRHGECRHRKTGGTFLIEKMPDPSAIWTRDNDKHTEWVDVRSRRRI